MWSLPSRGRPKNMQRFVDSYNETKASSKVYVRLDTSDPELAEYQKINYPDTFIVVIGPRKGLKAAMEEMFNGYPDEEWYGLAADDIVPRTNYWDQQLIAQAGRRGIAHPDDLGYPGQESLPTHPVVGGDLVRAVGWFGHPAMSHFYLDVGWQFIGESLDCITLRTDIVVEHMHPNTQKALQDQTYIQAKTKVSADKRAYYNWVTTHGNALITRLKKEGF